MFITIYYLLFIYYLPFPIFITIFHLCLLFLYKHKKNLTTMQFLKSNKVHEFYEKLNQKLWWTEYVYSRLESAELRKKSLSDKSFVFASDDVKTNNDKLLVLINGAGVVRAGQWSRWNENFKINKIDLSFWWHYSKSNFSHLM